MKPKTMEGKGEKEFEGLPASAIISEMTDRITARELDEWFREGRLDISGEEK